MTSFIKLAHVSVFLSSVSRFSKLIGPKREAVGPSSLWPVGQKPWELPGASSGVGGGGQSSRTGEPFAWGSGAVSGQRASELSYPAGHRDCLVLCAGRPPSTPIPSHPPHAHTHWSWVQDPERGPITAVCGTITVCVQKKKQSRYGPSIFDFIFHCPWKMHSGGILPPSLGGDPCKPHDCAQFTEKWNFSHFYIARLSLFKN